MVRAFAAVMQAMMHCCTHANLMLGLYAAHAQLCFDTIASLIQHTIAVLSNCLVAESIHSVPHNVCIACVQYKI